MNKKILIQKEELRVGGLYMASGRFSVYKELEPPRRGFEFWSREFVKPESIQQYDHLVLLEICPGPYPPVLSCLVRVLLPDAVEGWIGLGNDYGLIEVETNMDE